MEDGPAEIFLWAFLGFWLVFAAKTEASLRAVICYVNDD
jgi:hypothetical protein